MGRTESKIVKDSLWSLTGDKFQCLMMLLFFFTNRLEWFAWGTVMLPSPWGREAVPSVLYQFSVSFCIFPDLVGVGPLLMQFVFRQKNDIVVRSYYKARRQFLRLMHQLELLVMGTFPQHRVRSSFLSFLGSFYHSVWLSSPASVSHSLVAALLLSSSCILPLASRLVVLVFRERAGTVGYFNRSSWGHGDILHWCLQGRALWLLLVLAWGQDCTFPSTLLLCEEALCCIKELVAIAHKTQWAPLLIVTSHPYHVPTYTPVVGFVHKECGRNPWNYLYMVGHLLTPLSHLILSKSSRTRSKAELLPEGTEKNLFYFCHV